MWEIRTFNKVFNLLIIVSALVMALIRFAFGSCSLQVRQWVIYILSLGNILFFFFYYKLNMSKDAEYLQATGREKFNWWNELPLQLCNINMFVIPLGVLLDNEFLKGFGFFVAPLGAMLALLMPEKTFRGYSLWMPRILGFYGTHILIVICGISLATLGLYVPNVDNIVGILSVTVMLMTLMHIVNTILRKTVCSYANYFYTYDTVGVKALEWLRSKITYPLLYLFPVVLILIPYMYVITMIHHLFVK